MSDAELEVRNLESAHEMSNIVTVFQQVWGSVTPIVGVELLRAIGYVAGAYDGDVLIGASFGFLGRYHGEEALHSHVTGILPGVQHSGVGRLVKNHQRQWAAERGIGWITWTFDPLVRRNAWFNVEVLQAHIDEYLPDFYGTMTDSINASDVSDRLLVAWPTSDAVERPGAPAGSVAVEVETPADIVVLRRTDPTVALEWRLRVRSELGGLLDRGGVVTGFTREGSYVVHGPA
jgi:predicted GNAT superfamily acetyltransferase